MAREERSGETGKHDKTPRHHEPREQQDHDETSKHAPPTARRISENEMTNETASETKRREARWHQMTMSEKSIPRRFPQLI